MFSIRSAGSYAMRNSDFTPFFPHSRKPIKDREKIVQTEQEKHKHFRVIPLLGHLL